MTRAIAAAKSIVDSEEDGDVVDCGGMCASSSWIGDGICDEGLPWNRAHFMCEEHNWDNGDCEVIPGECPSGQIEDCNGNCAPESWLGDTFCDDGSYEFEGNQIFFNCEEFNNDEGDCDGQQRAVQQRSYPNGRIRVE